MACYRSIDRRAPCRVRWATRGVGGNGGYRRFASTTEGTFVTAEWLRHEGHTVTVVALSDGAEVRCLDCDEQVVMRRETMPAVSPKLAAHVVDAPSIPPLRTTTTAVRPLTPETTASGD